MASLAVEFVDEGDDGHVAQPADLEQLQGLGFDALGRVQHHHGGIDRGQGAVGILAEILVARGVQQIEHQPVMLEGHDRGRDRDAALLLDLHPVRAGAPALAAGAHGTRLLDGAAQQQQLLRERRLAGVGMGDDGEGPPPLGLGQGLGAGSGVGLGGKGEIHGAG